jgi:hypothetical protein
MVDASYMCRVRIEGATVRGEKRETMAEEVVATFSGPLSAVVGPPPVAGSELTVHNATSHNIKEFGISGRTAKFPVTWDEFPKPSGGPVGDVTIVGENTEVVMVRFQHFNPTETV